MSTICILLGHTKSIFSLWSTLVCEKIAGGWHIWNSGQPFSTIHVVKQLQGHDLYDKIMVMQQAATTVLYNVQRNLMT